MRKLYLAEHEQTIFDIYFSGIVAMSHCHPGAGIWRNDEGKYVTIDKPTVEDCADKALEMLEVRKQVLINSHAEGQNMAEEKRKEHIRQQQEALRNKNMYNPYDFNNPYMYKP